MAVTEHPLGGLRPEAVLAKADDLLPLIVSGLTGR